MKDGFAFAQRVLIATLVVVAVMTLLALVWYAADLLMLLFAAVLVSIPLRRLREFVRTTTGLGCGASLAVVILVLGAAFAGVVLLSAGRIASQADEFAAGLQSALEGLRRRYADNRWVQDALSRLPSLGELLIGGGALPSLTGFASTTLGAVINAAIVAIVAIYLAAQTELYSRGIKHLLPYRSRGRAGEVLGAIDEALGRWIMGRLVLMVINGALTAGALWAIGVPMAFTLGVIAGVLNFIPNFGPFIAAVPAVLIALVESPALALYTALVYLVVQMIDAYVLTPLVDRRSVELPPVVTVAAQLLLGVLFGFIGLLVASPFTATVMIVVKMLYVEDVLGDPITDASASSSEAPAPGRGAPVHAREHG